MRNLYVSLLSAVLIFGCSATSVCLAQQGADSVRPAAVAGSFYPGDPDELRQMVHGMLKAAGGVAVQQKIRGLVSPHAGYVYSGIVAAAGYKQLDPSVRTVILLGPSHRVLIRAASIPEVSAYRTPLGEVRLAPLASRLGKSPGFKSVPEAHLMEHSLEVQLPFLQVALNRFEIVPILVNSSDPEALAATLAPLIDENTLVVASSDLSHYYPYDRAVVLDDICNKAIAGGKLSGMSLCEACGKQAVLTLMRIAEIKGWQGVLIDYKNSGDTAGGKDRVVGYASIAFVDGKEARRPMNDTLSAQDRRSLLRLARSAIKARLVRGAEVERPQERSPALGQKRGCFVTLHKHGQLRGCIGTIEPICPLQECVEGNAQSAAFNDPRFPGLKADELDDIDIEISVLSVPQAINFSNGAELKDCLRPNVDGVILSRGSQRSTFLPQVWGQIPDKERFLQQLCLKGRMPADAWKDPKTRVETYQAEVFGEDDLK